MCLMGDAFWGGGFELVGHVPTNAGLRTGPVVRRVGGHHFNTLVTTIHCHMTLISMLPRLYLEQLQVIQPSPSFIVRRGV